MSTPHISVIIPTYQRTDMLQACLLALNEQTLPFEQFEVFAIDDQSPDQIQKKTQILDLPLAYDFEFIASSKGGPAKSRNIGAARARGELLVFLDDDTLPSVTWLEELSKAMQTQDVQGVGGTTLNIKSETWSEKLLHHVHHLHSPKDPVTNEVIFLVTVNAAIRKEAFEKVGGFDEGFKLPSGEDIDLGFRMREEGMKLGLAPKAVIYHHQRETLSSMFRNWYHYGQGAIRCQWKHQKRLAELDSYGDTTLVNQKKLMKHVEDYLGLYKSMAHDPNVSMLETLILPNLHVLNFVCYLIGRRKELHHLKKVSS